LVPPSQDLHLSKLRVERAVAQAASGTGVRPFRRAEVWTGGRGLEHCRAVIEVNADHGGMVKLVLPDVFAFFDRTRSK
jgi:hypothetical protein